MKISTNEAKNYYFAKFYNYDGSYDFTKILKRENDKPILQEKIYNENTTVLDWFNNNNIEIDSNEQTHIKILYLAMLYGVTFQSTYGMSAPYTHEYYVVSRDNPYINRGFCETITSREYETLAEKLYEYLLKNKPEFDYRSLTESLINTIKDYDKAHEETIEERPYSWKPTGYFTLERYKQKLRIQNFDKKDSIIDELKDYLK